MKPSYIRSENALFEEWAEDKGYDLAKIGKEYESAETNDAWFVWMARASLDYFN